MRHYSKQRPYSVVAVLIICAASCFTFVHCGSDNSSSSAAKVKVKFQGLE